MLALQRAVRRWRLVLTAIVLGSTVLGLISLGPSPSAHAATATGIGFASLGEPFAAASSERDCAQGRHVITPNPSAKNLSAVLLSEYDSLGLLGGGTIRLKAGTYTLPSTLVFRGFGNISIVGAGVGRTILSMPSDPVGHFRSTTGQKLGLWNYTKDRVVHGGVADLIRVDGPTPINNFEMCDLTLRGEANNASEDWDGSFLFDSSGGSHHVYENLALTGFYGPSTIPNGIHLESFSNSSRAYGYVVDNVTADNNTLPFESNPWVVGGPNFLNIGSIVNCTVENLEAIGLLAFEVAPPSGCLIENVHVSGHLLIDPEVGGSWGGTLFQNVTIDSRNTASPNAMGASIPNDEGDHGYSNFTDMRWNDCTFYGNVLYGKNLIDVENSSFFGGINATPSIFVHNYVNMTDWGPQYLNLPIEVDGIPQGGTASNFSGNTFIFPNSTFRRDPFVLNVPSNVWQNDLIEIAGRSTGYLLDAPNLSLARTSVFSNVSYLSLGNDSPAELTLMDLAGSPGFVDRGATVDGLSAIVDNLPRFAPGAPSGLSPMSATTGSITVGWDPSTGNVTNYTLYAGTNSSSWNLSYSAGLNTTLAAGGLAPNTTYYFEVVAWNESFPSSPSATVEYSTRPLPNYAPASPTDLTIAGVGETNVVVSWRAAVGNVTNYTVLVGHAGDGWFEEISNGLVLETNVTGLSENTSYEFAVIAWNVSWSSPATPSIDATTHPATSNSSGSSSPGSGSSGAPSSGSIRTGPSNPLLAEFTMYGIIAGVFSGVVGGLALAGHARSRQRRRKTSRQRRGR